MPGPQENRNQRRKVPHRTLTVRNCLGVGVRRTLGKSKILVIEPRQQKETRRLARPRPKRAAGRGTHSVG